MQISIYPVHETIYLFNFISLKNSRAERKIIIECTLQPRLGAIRLSLVQVDGTLLVRPQISKSRKCQKLGEPLFLDATA